MRGGIGGVQRNEREVLDANIDIKMEVLKIHTIMEEQSRCNLHDLQWQHRTSKNHTLNAFPPPQRQPRVR